MGLAEWKMLQYMELFPGKGRIDTDSCRRKMTVMIQECCIQHMDSQSATVRMTMNCSGSRYAPSGLPHQIIRDLKVGVRIILILRLLTQGAVQDNAPGIPLRDFIGNAGRDDGVLTVTTVINGQTGNGEAAADQLVLCQLIHRDFLMTLPSVKLKSISPLFRLIRFISISCLTWALISLAMVACFCCSLSCLSRSSCACFFPLRPRGPRGPEPVISWPFSGLWPSSYGSQVPLLASALVR